MSEWREVLLGNAPIEILDGDRGKNYPKKHEFLDEGFCLFLNTKNVTSSGFNFTDLNFITKEKDGILRKGKMERNDVVLTTRGTVGNVAFYNEKIIFDSIRINSGMVIIRPIQAEIHPVFNFQLFKYLTLDLSEFVSGSAQPQLPIRDLKQIPILLPPLPEQKAIAEVLSSLDDKIDLLHRQNKIEA
jgi:type I restriction enzyme S subunit